MTSSVVSGCRRFLTTHHSLTHHSLFSMLLFCPSQVDAAGRPQDVAVVIVKRKRKALEIRKEFIQNGIAIRGVDGNGDQLVDGNSTLNVHFILT